MKVKKQKGIDKLYLIRYTFNNTLDGG